MTFRELHYQEKPLLIGNVWDVPSARVFRQLNFAAIATSSAAVATMLGYQDGQQMSFTELEYVVGRIKSGTDLPLSVDIEAGYGSSNEIIIANIDKLCQLGISGINIEDSRIDAVRELLPAAEFSSRLSQIAEHIAKKQYDLLINVRTDTFLMEVPDQLQETQKRIARYQEAGADGIFVPGVIAESDIREIVRTVQIPVNVMCMPGLPDFDKLRQLGVRRISMGNFPHVVLQRQYEKMISEIINEQSFLPIA